MAKKSTRFTATVKIKNDTSKRARIQLKHHDDHYKTDIDVTLNAGEKMKKGIDVPFQGDQKPEDNFWSVTVTTGSGSDEDIYKSFPDEISAKLTGAHDSKENKTVNVEITEYKDGTLAMWVKTNSQDSQSVDLSRVGPMHKPKHIFVLMLENHSFDHLFGFSWIAGKDAVTRQGTNLQSLSGREINHYKNYTLEGNQLVIRDAVATVRYPAVDPMTTDPGHEFKDVFQQICGIDKVWDKTAGYPEPKMSGFAANYSTSKSETPHKIPAVEHRGDTMACCVPSQINALHTLALEYAVCDNWFSSMPGPTWPNRLFAMGGCSNGMDDSPTSRQTKQWIATDFGIEFENGSIFERVKEKGLHFRIYNDSDNEFTDAEYDPKHFPGSYPVVQALSEIDGSDVNALKNFSYQLTNGYDYLQDALDDDEEQQGVPGRVPILLHRSYDDAFTWIEPHYGNVWNVNFEGGSSQHPMDSLVAGDRLIAATYKAIRNSPLWKDSLLIITYDEHGGFYDHVVPPTTVAPGGNNDLNTNGFDFTRLGVRVPAVVVSPYIEGGIIDHTLYDHTTIIKTTCEAHGLAPLTERDKNANSLLHLLSGKFRDDCPTEVKAAEPPEPATPATAARGLRSAPPPPKADDPPDSEPLPESGNIWGFLRMTAKIDFELSDRSKATKAAIVARLKTIETYGQAREYFREVAAKVAAYRAARKAAEAVE